MGVGGGEPLGEIPSHRKCWESNGKENDDCWQDSEGNENGTIDAGYVSLASFFCVWLFFTA